MTDHMPPSVHEGLSQSSILPSFTVDHSWRVICADTDMDTQPRSTNSLATTSGVRSCGKRNDMPILRFENLLVGINRRRDHAGGVCVGTRLADFPYRTHSNEPPPPSKPGGRVGGESLFPTSVAR